MAPIVTLRLRPRKDVTVWLPFKPGGENYRIIKAARGYGTHQATWDPKEKVFVVPRSGVWQMIANLVEDFGHVRVVQHGNLQTRCVSDCWNARPDTAWNCECSCAGANHGTGHPLPKVIDARLSIQNDETIVSYDVDADGWHMLD